MAKINFGGGINYICMNQLKDKLTRFFEEKDNKKMINEQSKNFMGR